MAKCSPCLLLSSRLQPRNQASRSFLVFRSYASVSEGEVSPRRKFKQERLSKQQKHVVPPKPSNEASGSFSANRNQARETSTTGNIGTLDVIKSFWDAKGQPRLSSILLRDACRCSQCIDTSTRQRNFSLVDIPHNVRAVRGDAPSDRMVTVKWENDIPGFTNHVSTFSPRELSSLAQGESSDIFLQKQEPQTWSKAEITKRLSKLSYQDYMTSDEHLLRATKALQRDGILFLKDVPSSPESIEKIVERLGPIKNTFYGSTWDVKSKPNADNVAYTDKDLGFHMDLLYMWEPPRYQFLHCIQNSCSGGESRFADTIVARETMTTTHRDQAKILRSMALNYHYHNMGHSYTNSHPVFDKHSRVFWSPPFVESIRYHTQDPEKLAKALAAAKVFAQILEREDLVFEMKMEEGMCVIFENTRVVHARNAFDVNSGHRWLRGAYLDTQPLISTHLRLMSQSGR